MGGKYEVLYWDWTIGKEVSEEITDSIFRAIYLLHKLEKEWYCVTIKFRREKVKEYNKKLINRIPNSVIE